ncbi:MAG: flavodoxin family protein [Pseudomonadota bacterium]
MKRLLIVHHAPSGNTRKLLDASLGAIKAIDAELRVTAHDSLEADAEAVRECDGLLLATTENFGAMAGRTKDFFERIYYPLGQSMAGLPAACYIRAGEDGTGSRLGIDRIVTGLRWRWIQPPLVLKGPWELGMVSSVEELAGTLAAGLSADIF